MGKKLLISLLAFCIFLGVYSGVSTPGIQHEPLQNNSLLISSKQAREWIYNYARHPIGEMVYEPNDSLTVKIKSWEIDNKLIDVIRAHPEIKGLRCYLAKRSDDLSKKDYTILIVPYNSEYANISSRGNLKWVYDWHKPAPASSNISADTLGGPIR